VVAGDIVDLLATRAGCEVCLDLTSMPGIEFAIEQPMHEEF
jgi:hypothetical protein